MTFCVPADLSQTRDTRVSRTADTDYVGGQVGQSEEGKELDDKTVKDWIEDRWRKRESLVDEIYWSIFGFAECVICTCISLGLAVTFPSLLYGCVGQRVGKYR